MCFSWEWFKDFLIFLVVVCAAVGILKILIPFLMKKLGTPEASEGVQVGVDMLRIAIWAAIIIALIVFAFGLISCLWSGALFFPHR